jgi:hypothetical protein
LVLFIFRMAVGDFNGDGILDLVTSNADSTVSVLLGNGDGTLQPPINTVIGAYGSLVVGDFNGDRHLDIALVGYDSGMVTVLLGNGDGTFQVGQSYSVGMYPHSAVARDFNGDGIPDLVVPNDADLQGLGGGVNIMLGNGDGTFQAPQKFVNYSSPGSVAVGDFNGDGLSDLAVIYGGVDIFLGNGDGTFQLPTSYAAGTQPEFVAVADFNGDGIPDLAVADIFFQENAVRILLGKGDGTFQAAQAFAAGASPSSLAVGDFNGDKLPDLAVLGQGGVTVLLNAADWGP